MLDTTISDPKDENNYSLEVVDTIFADTLSRGMQNAIVSQQNAQMASSSSVTNACARILQAQPKPGTKSPTSAKAESVQIQHQTSEPQEQQSSKKNIVPTVIGVFLLLFAVGGLFLYTA